MRQSITVSVVVGLSLAACLGSSPQPLWFALEPTTPAAAPGAPYPFALVVRRFETALAYDRVEMVYRPRDDEVRFDDYRRWIARPGRMLSEVVASHLGATGIFEAVTLRPTDVRAQYELRGKVVAIEEVSRGPWQARLGLEVVMSSLETGEVVWEHAFDVVRDVGKENPRAVVAAMVDILDDELGRMATSLDQALARLTRTSPRLGAPTAVAP